MTDTDLIKVIAEFMGWIIDRGIAGYPGPDGGMTCLASDILTDLNLWHNEIEPRIEQKGLMGMYSNILYTNMGYCIVRASARDKAVALVKVING